MGRERGGRVRRMRKRRRGRRGGERGRNGRKRVKSNNHHNNKCGSNVIAPLTDLGFGWEKRGI